MTATGDRPASASEADLADEAFAWAITRLDEVDDLSAPTPCETFDLADLLGHLTASATRFATLLGAAATGAPSSDPVEACRQALTQARAGWATADLGRSYTLPIGPLPGAAFAMLSATEAAVHGWDVSQATGERADIPAGLADALLAFSTTTIDRVGRPGAFAPAIDGGHTSSERLVHFLGRPT